MGSRDSVSGVDLRNGGALSSFWDFFTGKTSNDAGQGAPPGGEASAPSRPGINAKTDPPQPGQSAPQVAAAPLPKPRPAYRIDDAIKLMRTLPVDENAELVVRVIRKTLESLNVNLNDIIDDAGMRQEKLRGTVDEHRAAIVQLERDIASRKADIARLEGELTETTSVRQRLELAQSKQTQARPAFLPSAAPAHHAAPPVHPAAPAAPVAHGPPPLPTGHGSKSVPPTVAAADVKSIPPTPAPAGAVVEHVAPPVSADHGKLS